MKTFPTALIAAAVLALGVAAEARADNAGRSQFFNPFSISRPGSSSSWLDVFRSPSVSTGLRGSFSRDSDGSGTGSVTASPQPIDNPVSATGRPQKPLPYRSPYSPPPRPPFGS